jgi:8-oxo-dGTP diphosphatase
MSDLATAAKPYAASYVLLRRDDGKVAFVMRANTSYMNGYYSLTAGKVEKDESFVQAAVREAKEEAGVVVTPDQLRLVMVCHRKESNETMSWVDVFFEATEWEGEVINAEPDQHSAVEWLDLDNLPENVIPPLRLTLEQITAGVSFYELGW